MLSNPEMIGELAGVIGDTVRNLISLTQLVPELMQMVDDKNIALTPAYPIRIHKYPFASICFKPTVYSFHPK